MRTFPTKSEIDGLFVNNDPQIVWDKAAELVRQISPEFDFSLSRSVFEDVLKVFHGEYPGYCAIKTPYHDLPHTLAAFMCGVRLMHGVHLSGDSLSDMEISLIMIAVMMHDVGYAQKLEEDGGTGAQYTQIHVQRGIVFLDQYLTQRKIRLNMVALSAMILGTEHPRPFAQIEFDSERIRLLARIVATADICGQMADRVYLEKLPFLFQEFNEAKFGNYRSFSDLFCKTEQFYAAVKEKLDGPLGGVYRNLSLHFKDTMGIDANLYVEAIDRNMNYLSKAITKDEKDFLAELRRTGGVAANSPGASGTHS